MIEGVGKQESDTHWDDRLRGKWTVTGNGEKTWDSC